MLMSQPETEVPATCAEVHWVACKIQEAVTSAVGGFIRQGEVNEHKIQAEMRG